MFFPALTLWQPYAQLPLDDAKPWETRGRRYPPKYHNRWIIVCSAKAFTSPALVTPGLHNLCVKLYGSDYKRTLPRGLALYMALLKDCRPTEALAPDLSPELLASGDFGPGRWAWEWEIQPLNPFPVSGKQGWFRVEMPDGAMRCATVEGDPGPLFRGAPEPATPALLNAQPSPGMNPNPEAA